MGDKASPRAAAAAPCAFLCLPFLKGQKNKQRMKTDRRDILVKMQQSTWLSWRTKTNRTRISLAFARDILAKKNKQRMKTGGAWISLASAREILTKIQQSTGLVFDVAVAVFHLWAMCQRLLCWQSESFFHILFIIFCWRQILESFTSKK